MSLFSKLRRALGAGPAQNRSDSFYTFHVRCRRCGEVLTGRVNLANDLSIDYEEDVYHVRKLVSGSGAKRCFQQIEVLFTFDWNKDMINREAIGGAFVDEPESVPGSGA